MIKNLLLGLLALSLPAEAGRNIPMDTAQYSTQGSAPGSPTAGSVYGYFLTSDGFPYWKNSAGSIFGYLYSASTLTNHAVLLGTGTRSPGSAGPVSSTAFPLVSGGSSADPAFALLTVPGGGTGLATLTAHAIQVGAGTSTPVQLGPNASTAFPLVSGGSSADPSYALLTVPGGGTGLATLTAHAVYVGSGTSAPTALTVGSTNQVLRGSSGADPAFGSLTVADMTVANSAHATCNTSATIDWSLSNNFTLTLTNGATCALTWSNAASGQSICIDLYQPGTTGSGAVSFATTTLKTATYTMTTGASATDTICVKYNGTDYRMVPQQVFL